MKASVREHINQLEVSSGGGIVSEKIRVDTIDNPMLVIGLGGTGIDALLRLKYQVNRRFKQPYDPLSKRKKEKPDNIEFLAFETNENDRKKTYKGIGLDPIKEYVFLSNPEIGGLLQDRVLLEPHIKEWLSPELKITDGINGASGVRQAGRLLLFTKLNQVIVNIEKKIESLLEGTNKRLYVFLLSGLSGGTGSGTFLDIAYITRGIMERKYGSAGVDKISMLGYMFTPDVNLAKKGLSSHTVEYIQKNGYAALKELDYWMNNEERGERFKMNYGNILNVNSPMPPFNLCHLISSTNLEGKLLENAYEYTMNVTAENITNFMASEEKSGEEFSIHDYISNIGTNIAGIKKRYSANYKYNIIGASMAEIPLEEMTTFVGYKLFEKMNSMFESNPEQNDVEEFAQKLQIDPDSVHRRFNEMVTEPLSGFENSDRFSYNNVIKFNSVNIDEELDKEFLARAKDQYRKCKKQLPGQIVEDFRSQMDRLFLHPKKGPIFASKLVSSNEGFCLLKTVQAYIEGLHDRLERMPQAIASEQDHAYNKLEDARSAFVSKEKKKNAYIEAKINEYYARAEKARIEEMIEFYEDFYALLNNEHTKMYEVYKEILEALKKIFEDNADILIKGEEVAVGSNVTYYWHLVSVKDTVREIERLFDSKDGDSLVQQWSQMLIDKSIYWIKETDIDIVGTVSAFLTEQFGELITRSMEDFLRLKYGEDKPIDKVIEQEIAARLNRDAIPVFHIDNSKGNLHFPSWGFVSVPSKAAAILQGVKSFQRHALSEASFTIKESELKNRIFWLNTKNGVPLYAFAPLKIYEENYEKTILDKEGIGRHLVMTESDNWAYLPSPIPEQSWGETYFNQRVKVYNENVRSVFAKAMEFGIIVEKTNDQNTSARYQCKFTKPLNVADILAEFDIDINRIDKASPGNLKACARKLSELLAGGMETDGTSDIFGSTTLEYAQDNLIRSPKLFARVKEEVRKFSALLEKKQEFDEYLAAEKNRDQQLSQFLEALYTKTICKKGARYVYDHDTEESAWEPLVNLLKQSEFIDFELFRAFTALSPKQMEQLLKKSSKRSDDLISEESTSQLVSALEEMAATYQKEKELLDYDRGDYANGEELYEFYREMMQKVNNMLRQLKS